MDRIEPQRHLPAELADAIRAARERRGWSLRAAAQHSGISLAMLHRLETGTRVPSVALAADLADAYELAPDVAEQLAQVAVPGRGRSGPYALTGRRSFGRRPVRK